MSIRIIRAIKVIPAELSAVGWLTLICLPAIVNPFIVPNNKKHTQTKSGYYVC